MSRLDELLQQYCPNGVKYVPLNAIAEYASERIDAKEVDQHNYVGVDNLLQNKMGKTESSYVPTEGRLIKYQEGDVLIGNIRPYLKKIWLAEYDGGTNGDVLVIHITKDGMLPKYLYYCLSSEDFFNYDVQHSKGSKMPRGDKSSVMAYEMPVPPLAVQEEIVRVLDEYTGQVETLKKELETELVLRKQQFKHYRDAAFDALDVPIIKIGDVTRVFSASRVHKDDWRTEGVPFYRSSDVMSFFNGVENSRGKAFISYELYEKLSAKSGKVQKDDILVTGGGTIGIPYIVPNDDPIYMKDADLLCIQKNDVINSKYLRHYFLSTPFRDYLSFITHDATIPHYTIEQIKNTPVPVPSWEEQERIVDVLDRFDVLCTDITAGLPAEITARQKQYEYYRDKLLSFEPIT